MTSFRRKVLAQLDRIEVLLLRLDQKPGGTVELGDMPKQVATTLGLVGAQSQRLDGLANGIKAGLDALGLVGKMVDDGNTAILGKLEDVRKQEVADMSTLSDKIADVRGSITAARDRVVNDVAGLKQQIADLQAKVDAGGATAEEIAALDELKTLADQIDPATPSTI